MTGSMLSCFFKKYLMNPQDKEVIEIIKRGQKKIKDDLDIRKNFFEIKKLRADVDEIRGWSTQSVLDENKKDDEDPDLVEFEVCRSSKPG